MAELLSPEAVQTMLGEIPEWTLDGDNIVRTFEFENFATAIKFVVRVAELAEKMNHHPDINIHWNRVRLLSTTHSSGGLTSMDFTLAVQIDKSLAPT
ncbi:MAG: 4a-hydroxytetrahydrobiopterin dehydratase [Verrucomicrobia bacterium]|nr:4a-hydroxytetrahydrobiopterin dehydratase [Verrucomicrobiota bacterium]